VRRVPRYFFHFSDGMRRFTDSRGHDLSGLGAARLHALKDVRDLKAALCGRHIQDLSGWTMTVADARGKPVFELGFDLQPRPRRLAAERAPHAVS
jgi:hypothetical protein